MGIYVQGLQQIVVESESQVQSLMDQGQKMRTASATKMNARSSRSHSIFVLKIQQKDVKNPQRVVFAAINLVDLAGSERASKTEATGARLKEGSNINKSLMSLGNVISALAETANGKKKFIPYRNSKLTRVLQNSLGGNSLCSMLATCSPALDNVDETMSTLKYANRAKMIKVAATKNEEMTQIDALKDEVGLLKKKLAQMATSAPVGGGLADEEKLKMKAEYEAQMHELKKHMNQTWEQKASASKLNEKERQLLLAKNREEQAQLKRRFELEKEKRWNLLEEKGDIEGLIRELQRHVQKVDSKDYTGLSLAELDVWCSMIAEARKAESSAKEQKTVLLVYKNAFEADMSALNTPAKSPSKGSSPGGAPPPTRVRAIIEQAQAKLTTLAVETRSWENLSENTLTTAKRVSKAMTVKLGPPPKSPTKQGAEAGGTPSSPSPSDEEAPFRVMEDEVAATKTALKPIVTGPKPPLSTKLLTRPPFRYLQDLVNSISKTTSFGQGLFVGIPSGDDPKVTTREYKVEYVRRLITCIGLGIGRALDCTASMVVAGSECEKTNRMLQHLAAVATDENIDQAGLVRRTVDGEKPKGSDSIKTNAPDPKLNGLHKEHAAVIRRALKMIRKIWLSSKSLQNFEVERRKIKYFGQSAQELSRTLKSESQYWDGENQELYEQLRDSASRVEPDSPKPPQPDGESSSASPVYDDMLGAFNVLQRSLSSRIKNEREASMASIASSEARLLELESQHQTLQREVQTKEEALCELKSQVSNAVEEKAKAVAAEAEWRKQSEDANKEKTAAAKELEKVQRAMAERESQLEEAQKSNAEYSGKLKDVGNEIINLKEKQTELESMNASLRSQVETSGEEQQALEKIQGELAGARGKLEATRMEGEMHEKEITKLEGQKTKLENALGEMTVALSAANSHCQEWEQKALEWEMNHRRLDDEHVAFKAENQKTLDQMEALKVKVEDASKERATADAARAQAMGEVVTLKERLKDMEESSSSKVDEQEASVQLQSVVLELTAKNELLTNRLKNVEMESKAASEAYAKVEKANVEIEGLKQQMKDQEIAHQNEKSVLEEDLEDARRKEVENYEELENQRQDLQDTQAGYVDLSDRLNDRVDQIYDLEEKLTQYKEENERLLARLMKAEADLITAKSFDGNAESRAPTSTNGGADVGSKDDQEALQASLEALKADASSLESRAVAAEEKLRGQHEITKELNEKITALEKSGSDLQAAYEERGQRLEDAEAAAITNMNTLTEHMKRSDCAIETLETRVAKLVKESERWEDRAVNAEAELMEIEERKLDEQMEAEKEAERKNNQNVFTGVGEIAEEPHVASGSGAAAVRHLAYSKKISIQVDQDDDEYGDDFDEDDEDDGYGEDDWDD